MENIRAVVIRDGDMWAVQCLEYDIGAQASSMDVLLDRLACVIDAERAESMERSGKAFVGIPEAPKYFWDLWERGVVPLNPERDVLGEHVQLALCA